jgi:hypothetical protein
MHVVERAEAIGRDANAPWVWHRAWQLSLVRENLSSVFL